MGGYKPKKMLNKLNVLESMYWNWFGLRIFFYCFGGWL